MLQFETGHINANQDMYSALTGLDENVKQNFIQEASTLLKEHLGIVDQIFNSETGST